MALGRRPLTVFRPAGAFDANGRWDESGGQTFTIEASVQPLRGRDLESLPEGRRRAESYRLYTETELRTVDDKGGRNPDRITDGITTGRVFEVIQVFPWQNGIVPHYKAIVSLLEQAPDGAG